MGGGVSIVSYHPYATFAGWIVFRE
jgi:hypothetical protein